MFYRILQPQKRQLNNKTAGARSKNESPLDQLQNQISVM